MMMVIILKGTVTLGRNFKMQW